MTQQERWDHFIIIKIKMEVIEIIIVGMPTILTSLTRLTLGSLEAAVSTVEDLRDSSTSIGSLVVLTAAMVSALFSHTKI